MVSAQTVNPPGFLGDTAERDYSLKLRRFNAFAEPELRECIAALGLQPGMRVLDAGCGTGEALNWLWEQVQPGGEVVGIDLATAHIAAARETAPQATIYQADLRTPPLRAGKFDLVWSANTINHLRSPLLGLRVLMTLLRPGGRIALGQSSLLADMYFAWDSRLERVTNEAVRQFYRDRYGLREEDLAAVRSIVGMARAAPLCNVIARTFVIERLAPLRPADEDYLLGALFRDTWGERLRPYLMPEDYAELTRLCDPEHPGFALRRPDFHFLQSFSLTVGEVGS